MDGQAFVTQARAAAIAAQHPFADYAVAEAWLETADLVGDAYQPGESKLCKLANNLFGEKAGPQTANLPRVAIPTREYLHGRWVIVPALWPRFESWQASFAARLELLKELSSEYPDYANALQAKTGEEFVTIVSRTWSTDPLRASKVLSIYRHHVA